MAFLDFCDNTGNIPPRSGINHMHSSGHISNYDAYIPIRMSIIRNNPGLIPPRLLNSITGNYNPITISVIWDDGHVMQMMFDGSQYLNGTSYPKQLSSTPSRNDLGYYLRNRMRLFDPTGRLSTQIIDRADFNTYGTTGIDLTLVNGQYYASFR